MAGLLAVGAVSENMTGVPGLFAKGDAVNPKAARQKIDRTINKAFVRKHSKKITEGDVEKVVTNQKKIRSAFESEGPLRKFFSRVELLIEMVKDYSRGNYRDIPWWAISAVVFALLYVISPIDLVPDVIPVVGQLDDAAVVSVVLLLVEQQLQDYESWRKNREAATEKEAGQ